MASCALRRERPATSGLAFSTEFGLIRSATFLAIAGVVIAGAGVAGYHAARSSDGTEPAAARQPVPYQAGKSDRLASLPFATRLPAAMPDQARSLEALRRGLASDTATSAPNDEPLPEVPPLDAPPVPSPRPWSADMQRSYAVLSDLQIEAIRDRLQLSPAQARHWPAVEEALRGIARRVHALKQANAGRGRFALPQDAPEMQRLKAAAAPLLARLREDQKREVRMLARIIGLDAVASRI